MIPVGRNPHFHPYASSMTFFQLTKFPHPAWENHTLSSIKYPATRFPFPSYLLGLGRVRSLLFDTKIYYKPGSSGIPSGGPQLSEENAETPQCWCSSWTFAPIIQAKGKCGNGHAGGEKGDENISGFVFVNAYVCMTCSFASAACDAEHSWAGHPSTLSLKWL